MSGPFEDEIRAALQDAAEKDPVVLSVRTGIGAEDPVSFERQINLCLGLYAALYEAVLRIAREIDETRAT